MPSDRDRRLLEDVVADVVASAAQVDWVPTDGWSAHARLHGATGLVSHLLTSPEWQEVRFEKPRSYIFIPTTTDENDVKETLAKLARVAVSYMSGGGRVVRQRRLLGAQSVLVLDTEDGEWRISKRGGTFPG